MKRVMISTIQKPGKANMIHVWIEGPDHYCEMRREFYGEKSRAKANEYRAWLQNLCDIMNRRAVEAEGGAA